MTHICDTKGREVIYLRTSGLVMIHVMMNQGKQYQQSNLGVYLKFPAGQKSKNTQHLTRV